MNPESLDNIAERRPLDRDTSASRRKAANGSPLLRSRVTNGSEVLAYVDERSAYARRFRDVLAELISDQGGEGVSAGTRALCRRAACLVVETELMESKFANAGEATSKQIESYVRASGALKRLFDKLGLDRKPRDITPDLDKIIDAVLAAEGK